ncbi:hypothetical protein D0U04_20865 [Bacillus clarus]|uniref:Uncharacterized protein n=1 Tax=Bacillus clarus TaxID=2338372 RepID=A0ABX9KR86_9BACI|nr:hypothetical protein D0U04_20865 [Bacillus clarus]
MFWRHKKKLPLSCCVPEDSSLRNKKGVEILKASSITFTHRIPPATYGIAIFDGGKFKNIP